MRGLIRIDLIIDRGHGPLSFSAWNVAVVATGMESPHETSSVHELPAAGRKKGVKKREALRRRLELDAASMGDKQGA
jgi:hypothetical protein